MNPIDRLSPALASAVVLMTALALSACAGQSVQQWGTDFGDRPEKLLYVAMRETEVTPEQRRSILALYDAHHPQLKALDAQADEILTQWRALDRHAPDFSERSTALSARWATVSGERMRESGALERELAGVLENDQWKLWREIWSEPIYDPRYGYDGGRGRNGGRRRD